MAIDLRRFSPTPADIAAGFASQAAASRRQCPDCGTIYNLLHQPPRKPGICDLDGKSLMTRKDDTEEVVREQSVIVQEIGAVADTPDDLIFEHLQVTAFPDQPLGRSILGTPKTVRSFDGAMLRHYLGRQYRAPDIVV